MYMTSVFHYILFHIKRIISSNSLRVILDLFINWDISILSKEKQFQIRGFANWNFFSFHDQWKEVRAFSIANLTLAYSSFSFSMKYNLRFDFLVATGSLHIAWMDTSRRIDVDLMSILHRYVKKIILENSHVLLTYVFDVISMGKKLTLFRRTLFDTLSMVEKSMLSRCTFSWRNLNGQESTSFWCTLFT